MARFVTTTRHKRDGKRPQATPMPARAREDRRQAVGRRLREAREAQGRSLAEVERAIKIHAHHLEAIESGDYGVLPDPLWGRGFLITYANYLRLDGERLARELFPPTLSFRPRRYLGRHWRALIAAIGAVGVAVALIFATLVASYDPLTGTYTGRMGAILETTVPGTFLGDEPQRVVVSGFVRGGATGRNDVVMVKVGRRRVVALLIPGDTRTGIPGHGRGEIGEASAMGGPDLARRSIVRLLDARVPYYCSVSPGGIREIVDSMGGMQVDVPEAVSGRASPGGPEVTIPEGRWTLNGDEALVYLRGEDLPDDAQRAERRLEFLYATLGQALDPRTVIAHPAVLRTVLENTETNMSGVQSLQLLGHIATLEESGTTVTVSSGESP